MVRNILVGTFSSSNCVLFRRESSGFLMTAGIIALRGSDKTIANVHDDLVLASRSSRPTIKCTHTYTASGTEKKPKKRNGREAKRQSEIRRSYMPQLADTHARTHARTHAIRVYLLSSILLSVNMYTCRCLCV